jgi:hypothetical protein
MIQGLFLCRESISIHPDVLEMVYKSANRLVATDAAYLAGLIDGEGTITLTRLNRNRERGLAVTISSTELSILSHVLAVIGAGKITNKKVSKEHHIPSYTYQITNRQALDVLQQISPHLRSYKAARAALVLRDYVRLTPRNGRYTEEQLEARNLFVQKFFLVNVSNPLIVNKRE